MTHAIVSPTGGFGNHLRWLLLLDPAYTFKFKSDISEIESLYNNLSGTDWPIFSLIDELISSGELNPLILNDISEKIDLNKLRLFSSQRARELTPFNTPAEKLIYISKYIYREDRSWHNWLLIEREFKLLVDDLIFFGHMSNDYQPNFDKADRIIGSTVDPNISLKTYIKFNSNLNGSSIDHYIDYITLTNNDITNYVNQHSGGLLIDSGKLFHHVLDKDLYEKITSWFGLGNYYKEASELHKLWFSLHKKAELEMINDLQHLFKGE